MLPRTRTLLVALVLLLALACPGRAAETFSGKVVGVADGDTIRVLRDGREVRVRLHGIDAPERTQAFSQKAKEFTSRLVFSRTVKVEIRDTDRYGRLVGVVFLPDDAAPLNYKLVRAGLAWWYQRYAPDDRKLEALEKGAREARRGLWVDPQPVPPWEFRRQRPGPAR